MRVIIAGSRWVMDSGLVRLAIERSAFEITEVVSGGARGVDQLGEAWARASGIAVKRFPITVAEWNEIGKAAGPLRNRRMASYVGHAGGLIAVWDGRSRGTLDMIHVARDCEIRTYVHPAVR